VGLDVRGGRKRIWDRTARARRERENIINKEGGQKSAKRGGRCRNSRQKVPM